jgi:hypothetical protein
MIRDFFVPLAELLFWLTGGDLLFNTLWVLVWVALCAIIIALPLVFAMRGGRITHSLPGFLFLIMFFPMVLVAVSPGIVQMNMISECLPAETHTVMTSQAVSEEIRVRHCRYKKNYYSEKYGEWKVTVLTGNQSQ